MPARRDPAHNAANDGDHANAPLPVSPPGVGPLAALAVVPAPSPVDDVRAFAAAAGAVFRQRADVIRVLLLAFVCPVPVNALLVGPPGTAKTAIIRAVSRAFGVGLLARTLSRWTDDAAFRGPPDLAALAAGRLARCDSGYLTDPAIGAVFCDELHRSGAGIRALLLPVMADRVTDDEVPVPAHTFIAATNMRLVDEDDLAMVDRFALRVEVPRVSGDDLRDVIGIDVPVSGRAPTRAPLPVLPADTLDTLRTAAANVDVPADVLKAVHAVAEGLRTSPPAGQRHPDVSERRWIIATRVLQASAALDGRASVSFDDLLRTLPFVLDDGPDTRAAIHSAITSAVPAWIAALADVERACADALALARKIELAASPVSAQQSQAHAARETTLTALRDSMQEHGPDAHAAASRVVLATLDQIDDVIAEGLRARRARR